MVEKTTPALEFWQRLNRNRLSTVGLLMLGFIFALCLMTPWLPYLQIIGLEQMS